MEDDDDRLICILKIQEQSKTTLSIKDINYYEKTNDNQYQ